MHLIRPAVIATLAAGVAFAVGAPAAHAQSIGGPCGNSSVGDVGDTAGTDNQVCLGLPGGLVDIQPSIGQVAYIAGPVITGPAGTVVVSAGAVILG